MDAASEAHARGAAKVGLVLRGTPPGAAALDLPGASLVHALPDDPVQYAHVLYAALHSLDDAGCAVVVVEGPPADDERWWAVSDRLRRAST
jgi:L-threonylcarbamoyladenylate synthase